eukprot:7553850-Lingulodinium_polyedra.AAC.1
MVFASPASGGVVGGCGKRARGKQGWLSEAVGEARCHQEKVRTAIGRDRGMAILSVVARQTRGAFPKRCWKQWQP